MPRGPIHIGCLFLNGCLLSDHGCCNWIGCLYSWVCYFQWMLISKVEEGNFIQHFLSTLAEPRVKSARLEPNLVFSVCICISILTVGCVRVCVRTYVRT